MALDIPNLTIETTKAISNGIRTTLQGKARALNGDIQRARSRLAGIDFKAIDELKKHLEIYRQLRKDGTPETIVEWFKPTQDRSKPQQDILDFT